MLLLPAPRAIAEDAAPAATGAEVAKPSVEELAIPMVAQKTADNVRDTDTREAMCLMIESAARANGLPLEFFARVIWQESRFQSDAVGPVTRSGQRAQGIAQFMPGTASERRLLDPFDPVQALPKSAEFLSELREQFGNLGLAAAAYNAGPGRVAAWLSSHRPLPGETRNYVAIVTGWTADEWASTNPPKVAVRASSLRSNFSWTFVGNVVYSACQWGMLVLLAKIGNPQMVGQYGLGMAIATPVLAEESPSPGSRVDRLERQGLLHRAQAPKSPNLFARPRPKASEEGSVLAALLEERRGGR